MDGRTVDWFLKYLPPSQNFVKISESILRITFDAPEQRVYFVGQTHAVVSSGKILACGYEMKQGPDRYYLCSAKSTALLCFEHGGLGGGILELHAVPNGLERIQSCQGFFNRLLSLDAIQPCILGLWCLKSPISNDVIFYEPVEQWKSSASELVNQQTEKPVIMICGPRKVGKSTYCRFLANSLLEKNPQVIMIDLDLGQTEFMPVGSISAKVLTKPLLGPPFSHVGLADLSYFVGATTPNEDYTIYLKNANTLLSAALSRFKGIAPVVINTMGWITGLGLHLLQYLVQFARPSHLLAFTDNENNENFVNQVLYERSALSSQVQPFDSQEKIAVGYLKSISQGSNVGRSFSPGDLRNLSLWAYFYHDTLHEIYDFGKSLSDFVPYVMPWDPLRMLWSTKRGMSLRAELTNAVANMSLVGLAISKEPNDIPVMIGMGLIRGVNPRERSYYIVSPLPRNLLDQVNCLVLGTINVPPQLIYYRNKLEGPYISYYPEGDILGGGARKTRYNLQRTGHQQFSQK
jgi:polynucleotide 5'-hydroxyl-kinase GRC3/NOL9